MAQASDSTRVKRSLAQRAAVLTSALVIGGVVFPSPLSQIAGDIPDRTLGLLKTLHLLGFASWFGTVVWVTFVAGIVMFRNMAREDFGRLQSKLFPRYFQMQTFLGSIVIATYYFVAKPEAPLNDVPLLVLLVGLGGVLANLVVIEPIATRVMFRLHKLRKDEGNPGKNAGSPELKKQAKRFGMLHGFSSLANLLVLGAGGFHLHYLSTKLTLAAAAPIAAAAAAATSAKGDL